eukprot:c40587_g1_i1 orf=3-221(-)
MIKPLHFHSCENSFVVLILGKQFTFGYITLSNIIRGVGCVHLQEAGISLMLRAWSNHIAMLGGSLPMKQPWDL